MKLTNIAFIGLLDGEAEMLIAWFEEIRENYDIEVSYTNNIIDDMTNDVSFDITSFDFSTHEEYIELTLKGHNSERATIYANDFHEIILK